MSEDIKAQIAKLKAENAALAASVEVKPEVVVKAAGPKDAGSGRRVAPSRAVAVPSAASAGKPGDVKPVRPMTPEEALQAESRRQQNRRLANREEPLTDAEAQTMALGNALSNLHADNAHKRLVQTKRSYNGFFIEGKGKWEEVG